MCWLVNFAVNAQFLAASRLVMFGGCSSSGMLCACIHSLQAAPVLRMAGIVSVIFAGARYQRNMHCQMTPPWLMQRWPP